MAVERRILILGAGGFVGSHLRKDLAARFGATADVIATARSADVERGLTALDLCDAAAIEAALERLRPTHVVNLVGIAAPVEARRNPAMAWMVHAQAPEALGRAIQRVVPECWLLHVGSGLIYGRSALSGAAMTEESLLQPMDPYGVTKAAGDLALGAMAGEGLRVMRLRPFNHTGPGQTEDFVVPAFAAQLARIAAGRQDPVMRVGNLDAERDFLDVRDVVAAYGMLIAHSETITPGAVYNIASGTGLSMRAMLDRLIALAGHEVRVELDPARQRPSDLPRLVGDAARLARDCGWSPAYDFDRTLADTMAGFS